MWDTDRELFDSLKRLFHRANEKFIRQEPDLFEMKVSERTLCGALMLHLNEEIKHSVYSDYHVDVEYNRNKGGKLKTCRKTIQGPGSEIIVINCDLIVHSRGHILAQDNLIAVEMKKSTRSKGDKDRDRSRLCCLTMDSFDDVWSYDGVTLPERVCRYALGVYYEVKFSNKSILLEYYYKGSPFGSEVIHYR